MSYTVLKRIHRELSQLHDDQGVRGQAVEGRVFGDVIRVEMQEAGYRHPLPVPEDLLGPRARSKWAIDHLAAYIDAAYPSEKQKQTSIPSVRECEYVNFEDFNYDQWRPSCSDYAKAEGKLDLANCITSQNGNSLEDDDGWSFCPFCGGKITEKKVADDYEEDDDV